MQHTSHLQSALSALSERRRAAPIASAEVALGIVGFLLTVCADGQLRARVCNGAAVSRNETTCPECLYGEALHR